MAFMIGKKGVLYKRKNLRYKLNYLMCINV